MRRRATGHLALKTGLVLTALLVVPAVRSTPLGATGTTADPLAVAQTTPPSMSTIAPPAAAARQSPESDASKPVPTHDDSPPQARLSAADDKLPGAPGRVAMLSASVVAVEEDPKVDLGEVIRSVLRSTADAVPWLQLASPHPADRRLARLAAEQELRRENSVRFDDAGNLSGDASARAAGQNGGTNGAAMPLLSHEVVQFARELIDNPLAWMIGFLVVMSGVTLSFVRGRDRSEG